MDDTENFLNDILKKRLGSVVSYGSTKRTANNVTRMPQKQQKLQSMPTVFRKKHETIYKQSQTQQKSSSRIQSEYLSMQSGTRNGSSLIDQQVPEENAKGQSNQRVQYMLISKRIQNKKQDDFISPVVDVTKHLSEQRHQQTAQQTNRIIRENGFLGPQQHSAISQTPSQASSSIDTVLKSKRKKIFDKSTN